MTHEQAIALAEALPTRFTLRDGILEFTEHSSKLHRKVAPLLEIE